MQPLERRTLLTVHFTVDPTLNAHSISRFIYGINQSFSSAYSNDTFTRLGGNRWTAYNWENNASNAGSDYLYQNDGYLSSSNTPGAAVSPSIIDAANHNAGILVTVPTNGYVSADKNPGGDVRNSGSNYLQTRFKQELPAKGSAFTLTPSTTDAYVYEDEFINWVKTNYPYGQTDPNKPIWFDLDNEPDLWSSTHAEVHPANATYQELVNDSVNYATAIKAVEPNTLVFGGVNYGWNGFTSLQGATQDPSINDTILNFQASYLKAMHAADQTAGHKLVDVLDMHWYPEALGTNGVRITENDNTAATVAARLQAPRSLWDPTYVENSWITQDSLPYQPAGTPAKFKGDAIQLLPREQAIVNEYDPGTKISISEYDYGGATDISGGIAEADVLGIFGQQNVFSANEWPLQSSEPFIAGGMNMFRNYDGANSTFGDTSISATTDDTADTSIYASVDSAHPGVLTLVAINKTNSNVNTILNLKNVLPQSIANVYTLTSASSTPQAAGTITIGDPSNINYTMLPMSVNTIRIQLQAPNVTPGSAAYAYQTAPNKLSFTFNQNVSASLAASDVAVTGAGGSSIALTLLSYDATNTATFSMPTPLADGNYTATITAAGVSNTAFQTMPVDSSFNFFFLTADANHDGVVNALDFNALASNFGKPNKTFADGDFNYSGTIDTLDFTALATHFGNQVPTSAATLFATSPRLSPAPSPSPSSPASFASAAAADPFSDPSANFLGDDQKLLNSDIATDGTVSEPVLYR